MLCPVCTDTPLQMSTRQNVEIDYCPKCRGVWLDRGELDKIIERTAADYAPAQVRPDYDDDRRPTYHHSQDEDHRSEKGYKPKKKRSFLDEVFDIF